MMLRKDFAGLMVAGLAVMASITILTDACAQENGAKSEAELQQAREQAVTAPAGSQEEALVKVQASGLMGKGPDGKFHAERPLSRAELASVLVKAFKLERRQASAPDKGELALRDVPAGYWAANDIDTVVDRGIMAGYRDHYFYPSHSVSRAEALAIFAQAYGVQQYDGSTVNAVLSQYPDAAQVPDWARKSVATSLKNGFVDVMPSHNLRPLQPMTRGTMAYILAQYLNRLDQSEQRTLH